MSLMQKFGFGWGARRKAADHVAKDASALMEIWGEVAHDVAADLAWREDAGLLHTAVPGHWARVQREIGLRLGLDGGWDAPLLAAA